jgi:magnesium transporter
MLVTYPVDRPSPAPQGAKPLWFDLFDPSEDDRASVQRTAGLKLPSREQLSEVESSSRVNVENGVLTLSVPGVVHVDDIEQMPSPVGFVLSREALVTIRYARLHSFEQVVETLRSEDKDITSAEMFTRLVEAMVDFIADMLEKFGADLGRTSREVFRRGQQRKTSLRNNLRLRNTLADIGEAGDQLSEIRDTLQGLQRIVLFTCERADWIAPDLHSRLKTAGDDLKSLANYETQLFEKAQFLLDAVLGFISTEQNDIFRVLTIVSVVGIPPTLIASMYGMNFKNMPELSWEWGYQWGLGLIALSIILPILWFRRRGWL